MKAKGILFFVSLFCCSFLTAQHDTVPQLVSRLEASNDHKAAILTINDILNNKKISQENRLALQTTLVHQYHELQQWDSCLNYCQQQVAAAHAQNNTLAEATFYKMIGNTYYHIPDKDKAIQYWKKCIDISAPARFNLLLEQCYHNIGSVILESNKEYEKAEHYLLQAITLSVANKTDTTQLGNLHYRLLATLYRLTNRYEKADRLFNTVIEKARKLNDSLRIAEALMFYSSLLADEKKFDEAIEAGKEALRISQQFNKLDMEKTAMEMLANNYASAGNYKEAFIYVTEANSHIINRFKTDLNSKISDAEAQFKNAELQHEKELALVNAKKEKQLYLLIAVILLAAAGFVINYLYQKRNLRQKLLMQQQVQEEKERLSRDLHDNLGSQMALLSNNIETLDINFKKQLDIDSNIEKVKGTSKQLLQTLREAIWILNKEQVTAQDFFDKLIDYAQRFLQSYPGMQLKVEENFSGNKQLNSNEALQLFRICQEAVTNACKYSGSEQLLIKGNSADNLFTVTIQDFGNGFDETAINGNGHYGLKNMQQRAAAINAAIKIAAAKGVSITVTI